MSKDQNLHLSADLTEVVEAVWHSTRKLKNEAATAQRANQCRFRIILTPLASSAGFQLGIPSENFAEMGKFSMDMQMSRQTRPHLRQLSQLPAASPL